MVSAAWMHRICRRMLLSAPLRWWGGDSVAFADAVCIFQGRTPDFVPEALWLCRWFGVVPSRGETSFQGSVC